MTPQLVSEICHLEFGLTPQVSIEKNSFESLRRSRGKTNQFTTQNTRIEEVTSTCTLAPKQRLEMFTKAKTV